MYSKLSTARQVGMGLGPVPVDIIWEWMDRAGVRDPRVRDHVEATLLAVDAITLRRANKAASKTPSREPGKSPARPRRRKLKS